MTHSRSFLITILLISVLICTVESAEVVLVPSGSTWKYLDNGTNQNTAWRSAGFDDSAWASGAAQLGYGDSDEQTVVSYGPNSSAKYITTYFRRSFNVPNPSAYKGLTLNLLKDDGAVVYLNGVEIHRINMPAGSILYNTPASSSLGSPAETSFFATTHANTLLTGTNVLAVEIHQSGGGSTDISFDLEFRASDSLSLTRGPYLQLGSHNSMVVKWRTNAATNSRVRYGLDPLALNSFVDATTQTTEHEIKLSNLIPFTQYYYSVGNTTQVFAGGDASHFFYTSPLPDTDQPTRIWVLGDSGTANSAAASVRNAYLNHTGSQYTNLWLMLGDNAYETGTDPEYQAAVFNMYPSMLRQSPLWPTLGNHDGVTADSATQSGPYYDIFKLPKQGEIGGVPSGTEAYYSFDYGNIHFICLESNETNRSSTGPMMTWLQNDVNSTTKDWIIAFWHHPPYSKGSHNSDTESQLIQMRQNALPILEQAGVDLVLTGHSHSYERSYLIDGHYGLSSTFVSSMKKDGGSGRIDSTGSYKKASSPLGPHEGAVYAVAGSSGKISGGTFGHPAMFISLNNLGSMVLDVNGNRLDAKFLDQTGVVRDYFTIEKGTSTSLPTAPTNLTASAISSSQINLLWSDKSSNETGFKIERSTNGTTFTQIATTASNVTSFSNTGLAASITYYYRVRAFNGAGNSGYSNTANATTQSAAANGLSGAYYDNDNFTGTVVNRVDPQIAFDWGSGAPVAGINADTFSVRWTGFVMPQYSETYTFTTNSNDGVRLWVNNQLIIDQWILRAGEQSGTITLQAGQKYAIRLEYFENTLLANVRLYWASPSRTKQTIPSDRLFLQ